MSASEEKKNDVELKKVKIEKLGSTENFNKECLQCIITTAQ